MVLHLSVFRGWELHNIPNCSRFTFPRDPKLQESLAVDVHRHLHRGIGFDDSLFEGGTLRRDQTNFLTLTVLTVVTLLFRAWLVEPTELTYWYYYVWVELFGAFLIVQFWAFTK